MLIGVPRYTSQQLHKAAKRLGVVQSMGRTGVCFDCQSVLTRSRKDWGVLAGVLWPMFTIGP